MKKIKVVIYYIAFVILLTALLCVASGCKKNETVSQVSSEENVSPEPNAENDVEEISVDEEFTVELQENQGVDGF